MIPFLKKLILNLYIDKEYYYNYQNISNILNNNVNKEVRK